METDTSCCMYIHHTDTIELRGMLRHLPRPMPRPYSTKANTDCGELLVTHESFASTQQRRIPGAFRDTFSTIGRMGSDGLRTGMLFLAYCVLLPRCRITWCAFFFVLSGLRSAR